MKAARGNVSGFHERPSNAHSRPVRLGVTAKHASVRRTQKPENRRVLGPEVAFQNRKEFIGSRFRICRKIPVVGLQNPRGQRRRKQIAQTRVCLNFGIDAETVLEQVHAVNRQQN